MYNYVLAVKIKYIINEKKFCFLNNPKQFQQTHIWVYKITQTINCLKI